MNCKLELKEHHVPVLVSLHKAMIESMNELGFRITEDLTAYALIRTFTILRTIKSISEEIMRKDRTKIIKNIQRLTEMDDLLFNQLRMLLGIINGRKAITGIIDSTSCVSARKFILPS